MLDRFRTPQATRRRASRFQILDQGRKPINAGERVVSRPKAVYNRNSGSDRIMMSFHAPPWQVRRDLPCPQFRLSAARLAINAQALV